MMHLLPSVYPNPWIPERADPHVMLSSDGTYYFTASYPMKCDTDPNGYDRIILRRANRIEDLPAAPEKTIWQAGKDTESHRFIWAPEIHEIHGKWFIFYAGSDDINNSWAFNCRVLVCQGSSPYDDAWEELGRYRTLPNDSFSFTSFSLDMTYFEVADQSYVIWAQHNEEKVSCLYIARTTPECPYQLTSLPMLLSQPEYSWERIRYAVNEGPSVMIHNGTIVVCYSASGTGPEYCVGILTAKVDSLLLDPASWSKQPRPLLTSKDLVDEYGPGHNSMLHTNDGDFFIYHARDLNCYLGHCGYSQNDPLYDPCRHARIRRIQWEDERR